MAEPSVTPTPQAVRERLGKLSKRAYDSQETARADKRARDAAIAEAEQLGWTAQQICDACITGRRRPGEQQAPHLSVVHIRRILALMSTDEGSSPGMGW